MTVVVVPLFVCPLTVCCDSIDCLLFGCCLFVVCLLFVRCLFMVCLLLVCCLFVVCLWLCLFGYGNILTLTDMIFYSSKGDGGKCSEGFSVMVVIALTFGWLLIFVAVDDC